jgi:peptidoglycan hydrolase-like protein with peptidoglycan-binding domain
MEIQSLGVVAALACAAACGPTDGSGGGGAFELSDAEAKSELAGSELGLGPGAEGPAVLALQQRLTEIGYFPNDDLAREWPAWRAVVDESPTPGVFDDATERAVKALQEQYGAKVTGLLDEAAVALLTVDRCSQPDGIAELDPSLKFNDHGTKWLPGAYTWKVDELPSNLSRGEVEQAVNNAFNTWASQQSDTTWVRAASGATSATLTIRWAERADNLIGGCNHPGQTPHRCTMNTKNKTWSVVAPTPSGSLDVEAAVVHEIGHGIGIAHSGICRQSDWPNDPGMCSQDSVLGTAKMFPYIHADSSHRVLASYDDYLSISALYDQFETLAGSAHDIGSANRLSASAWKVGTTASGSNFKVEKWTESSKTWSADATMTGVRIAVTSNNVPWVVKANGEIWTQVSGSWVQRTGCAKDIGIGDTGGINSVWTIGCAAVGSDYYVEKWHNSSFVRDASNGAGVRIAVGRYSNQASTPAVVPWVVTSSGSVWRRYSDSVSATTGWENLPGLGKDITVCGSGVTFAWLIGLDDQLWMWREQPAAGGATALKDWFGIGAKTPATRAVSCAEYANRIWAVASNGTTTRNKR